MARVGNSAETPVIPGFFPDPTVCRVGDDYYLATSSFEYFPGAPIFHSTDLVQWTQIGNILATPEHMVAGEARPSGGIWAGTLRHHEGLFYFITTNTYDLEAGQMILTATDPAGPWSAPIHVPGACGIDPDIAWDDDGTCLITWHKFDWTHGGQAVLQARVDTSTGDLLGPPYEVWQGSGLPAAEGPHLYRIGEWWYLTLAEGGTEKGHCVTVARSRQAQGPYEGCPSNPILTSRSTFTPVQCTGHADLVTTPDGGWAAVYLGNRPRGGTPGYHVLGRETLLAGVDWVDGWPQFVRDRYDIPAIDTSITEHFDGEPLGPEWVTPVDQRDCLDNSGQSGIVVQAGAALCTRVRDLEWVAEADVAGSGGLSVRIDARHSYGLQLAEGFVVATSCVGGLTVEVGRVEAPAGEVTLRVASQPPKGLTVPRGDAGPDEIVLSVVGEQVQELSVLDGRYISTEVASGFTGRVLALGCDDVPTTVTGFRYSGR